MKKFKKTAAVLAAAVTVAALFSGCSFLYDESVGNNIGPYVDPANNLTDDYLPDDTTEKIPVATPESSDPGDTENSGVQMIGDTMRVNTPPVEGEYYIGDGFQFYVPFLWREAMAVEITPETDGDYTLHDHVFLYIGADGNEAAVFTMRVLPYDYYSQNGRGDGSLLIDAVPDEDVYLLMPPQALPDGFTSLDSYLEILSVISDSSRLEFSRTTGDAAEE